MYRVGDVQPHVAVDAAAGIPSGCRAVAVVDLHGHHIVPAWLQEVRDVQGEGSVAVRMEACLLPVHIYSRAVIYSIEFKADAAAFPCGRHCESLAVPADAALHETHRALTTLLRREVGESHAPVVRQLDAGPCAVVKISCLRSVCGCKGEFPVEIESSVHTLGCECRSGCQHGC